MGRLVYWMGYWTGYVVAWMRSWFVLTTVTMSTRDAVEMFPVGRKLLVSGRPMRVVAVDLSACTITVRRRLL